MTDSLSIDNVKSLVDAVEQARASNTPFYIRGGNSKSQWLGRKIDAKALDVSTHRGIVDYQPAELVITVRSGTSINEINQALSEQGQMLASEPPALNGATIGGTVACNLSGPGRPWGGSIRDAVLGVQLINGRGELLRFGGQVMKNVAGYDVSRLQAGALGTLGVLTEVSLKVLPLPETTLTLAYSLDADAAVLTMNQRSAEPAPLSGAFWQQGKLYLRLSGTESAVRHTAEQWGGERSTGDEQPWQALREMTLPIFHSEDPLWRLSIAATAAVSDQTSQLIDWGGAQRWLPGGLDFATLHKVASAAGGHTCLFSGGDRSGEVRSPLGAAQQRIQLRVKQAFDPDGLINPGRLYSWM
jgi:glycolate oxidase FAD binding subunit